MCNGGGIRHGKTRGRAFQAEELFPRHTDTSVTGLPSQERGSSCGMERQQGRRTTHHGKRHEDFIPSAVEDISGIP